MTTSRLTTFSDGVRGNSSNTSTDSGQVYFATPASIEELLELLERRRRPAVHGDDRGAGASPRRSSGSGTIATSRTSGWRRITGSTSDGTIVTPPRRMMSLLRPDVHELTVLVEIAEVAGPIAAPSVSDSRVSSSLPRNPRNRLGPLTMHRADGVRRHGRPVVDDPDLRAVVGRPSVKAIFSSGSCSPCAAWPGTSDRP